MRQRYIVLALIAVIALALMLPSSAISAAAQPWNWKESGALGNGSAMSLAYDATRNILYRGTHSGVYKYQDGKFTSLGGEPEADNISCLAYDVKRNVLYAGTSPITNVDMPHGVWRCDNPDTNPTWTDIAELGTYYGINSLAYDANNNALYIGVAAGPGSIQGVWRCDNPNTTPTLTNTGGVMSGYQVTSLAYDSTHNFLYAGASFHAGGSFQGVWRCASPNTSSPAWIKISTTGDVGDQLIDDLTYDNDRNLLYAGTIGSGPPIGGVWRCDIEHSLAWTEISPPATFGGARKIAYDPVNNILYAAGRDYVHEVVWRFTNPDTGSSYTKM